MTRVRIWAEYEVTDEPTLRRYAEERARAAWGEEGWEPETLGEAVLEAVIRSNENPDNSKIGLEVVDHGSGTEGD